MNNLIDRAKAYLAHPPANFPEGVSLIREFVAESDKCACPEPDARKCSQRRYGDPIEQRDGECECACHYEAEA